MLIYFIQHHVESRSDLHTRLFQRKGGIRLADGIGGRVKTIISILTECE